MSLTANGGSGLDKAGIIFTVVRTGVRNGATPL